MSKCVHILHRVSICGEKWVKIKEKIVKNSTISQKNRFIFSNCAKFGFNTPSFRKTNVLR